LPNLDKNWMTEAFRVAVLTLPGLIEPSTAVAANRAGELGLLDLEYVNDQGAALRAVKKLAGAVKYDFGVKRNAARADFIEKLLIAWCRHSWPRPPRPMASSLRDMKRVGAFPTRPPLYYCSDRTAVR